MALAQLTIDQVADAIFPQAAREEVLVLLSALGARTGKDIEYVLHDPVKVRHRLQRPLPAYISSTLLAHGLVRPRNPAGDAALGSPYLCKKEPKQCEETRYVIKAFFDKIDLGGKAKQQQVDALLDKVSGIKEGPDEDFDRDEVYSSYNDLLVSMAKLLPVQFSKVEQQMSLDLTQNDSAMYRFLDANETVIWMAVVGAGRYQDSCGVGWLMLAMDGLFAEQVTRSHAFGAVLIIDFLWVFKFTPESFEPTACLYQLIGDGALQTLAKMMCAPPAVHGLINY